MATQSPSGSATDNAKEQVQEKAQDAQEKLKGGAQQAQARMREQVDQRSTQAGEQVSATADALRTSSRQLRDQGQDGPAQAAEKVAHHAERLGGYLSESSADRLRWNSKAEPWNSLVPPLVTMLTIAPWLRPYCAEKLLVMTWYSAT